MDTSLRITCLGVPIEGLPVPESLRVVIPPPRSPERRLASGLTLRGDYAQVLQALGDLGERWGVGSGSGPRISVKVVVEQPLSRERGKGVSSSPSLAPAG